MIRVITVENTCTAAPAQWEGRTNDDRPVYVRYRYGGLEVRIGQRGADVESAVLDGELAFAMDDGNEWGGFMDLEQLRSLTAGAIEWPEFDAPRAPATGGRP